MTDRSKAAKKAWVTIRARKSMLRAFGPVTTDVVRAKLTNNTTDLNELREIYGKGKVAAILANLTRGTYKYFLKDCNWG